MVTRRNPIRRDVSLRVAAAPVAAYSPPARPERSGLHELATALEKFSPELERFLNQRIAQQNAEDAIQGEAEFFKQNAGGYAEGVRQGRIPSYASPGFVAGWRKAEGNVAGIKLTNKFQAEWMAWPGKDEADPQAFDAFYQDFIRRNVTTDDPLVLQGVLPRLQQLTAGAYDAFTQERHRVTYDGSLRAHMALGGQTIDEATTGGAADYGAMHENLMAIREEAIATGMRADDFDKEYVDLVTAKALELSDPGILGLLDKPVPGQSYTYADTPDGRDTKIKAEDTLERMALRRITAQAALDTKADAEAKKRITAGIIDHIAKDPMAPIPEEVLRHASRYIPDIRTKVVDWQTKLSGGRVAEDQAAIAEVQRRIVEGGGTEAVREAFDQGIINDPTTFRTLWNFADARETAGGASARVLQGSVYQGTRDAIRQRTLPPDFYANMGFDPGGMSNEGLQAVADYETMLLEWHQSNPDASLQDIRKAQSDIGALVLKGIAEGAGPKPKEPVRRSPQAETVAPSSFSLLDLPSEVIAWARSLEPAERVAISERAARAGIGEAAMLLQVWQRRERRRRGLEGGPDGATEGNDAPGPSTTPQAPPRAPARSSGGLRGLFNYLTGE